MLVLTGQGDTYIKIVNKKTWDWIFSPPPVMKKHIGIDTGIPQNQIEARKKDKLSEVFTVTSGSYENDRAMGAYSDDGFDTYYKIKDALKALEKKNIKIKDEWHGHIY